MALLPCRSFIARVRIFDQAQPSRVLLFLSAFCLFPTCFLLFSPAIAPSAEVTIAWSPSPDPKVIGYRVYYGPSGRDTEFQADARTETKIILKNLQEGGTYSFTVMTYDTAAHESRYSHKTTALDLKDKDTHFLAILPSSPPISPGPPSPFVQEKTSPDAARGCEFAILPASQSIGSSGGAGAVGISAKLNCLWTAVANVSWVTITSNDGGTGNQVVYYLVKANPSASSREGTLTVAGQAFRITQAGQARHTLNISKIGSGSGTVVSFPAGTDFEAGAIVTLSAAPSANSDFAGWSGQCSGTAPTCSVAMTSSTGVNAIFKLKTFVIGASAGAHGSVAPSGRVVVNHGASRKFVFKPNKGYQIGQVRVDGASVGKPEILLLGNIMRAHKVDAVFVPLR